MDLYRSKTADSTPWESGHVDCVGLGYIAVRLENGNCGLAYTLHEKEYESCGIMPDEGKLAGRKAVEFIPWIKSPDVTACAVGLATLNAILPIPEADLTKSPIRPHGLSGYLHNARLKM
jgi:hypothetical protein